MRGGGRVTGLAGKPGGREESGRDDGRAEAEEVEGDEEEFIQRADGEQDALCWKSAAARVSSKGKL